MSIKSTVSLAIARAAFRYGALTTLPIESQKIFEGVAFGFSKRFTLGASAADHITIDLAGVDDNKRVVVLPIVIDAFGGGPIDIDLYSGTVVDTTPTTWYGINRDAENVAPAQTKLYYNPTFTGLGDLVPTEFMIGSAGGIAAVSTPIGGKSGDNLIFLPDTTKNYTLKILNTSDDEAKCLFAMNIFEVIRK